MKYAWIAEQGLRYPLVDMCQVLDVSVSGYRAWKRGGRPDRKRLTDLQMLALIRAIHADTYCITDVCYTIKISRYVELGKSIACCSS